MDRAVAIDPQHRAVIVGTVWPQHVDDDVRRDEPDDDLLDAAEVVVAAFHDGQDLRARQYLHFD